MMKRNRIDLGERIARLPAICDRLWRMPDGEFTKELTEIRNKTFAAITNLPLDLQERQQHGAALAWLEFLEHASFPSDKIPGQASLWRPLEDLLFAAMHLTIEVQGIRNHGLRPPAAIGELARDAARLRDKTNRTVDEMLWLLELFRGAPGAPAIGGDLAADILATQRAFQGIIQTLQKLDAAVAATRPHAGAARPGRQGGRKAQALDVTGGPLERCAIFVIDCWRASGRTLKGRDRQHLEIAILELNRRLFGPDHRLSERQISHLVQSFKGNDPKSTKKIFDFWLDLLRYGAATVRNT